MNEQDKEDYGKIFDQYTEISSENASESGKESSYLSLKKTKKKRKENDNMKGFGDFVLMMDNKEEYKKMILDKAKGKYGKLLIK